METKFGILRSAYGSSITVGIQQPCCGLNVANSYTLQQKNAEYLANYKYIRANNKNLIQ